MDAPRPRASAGPIRESGWYRLGPKGWTRVADADAELEELTGDGWDLVRVQFDFEDIPLF
jgi:hypothetical protein